ncbi:putative E3 ubiquitin-protein ligase HERC1 [Symbiodinium microadriaticum]|uniref:Putative E3 ubiquitin-protein ligase HERC1 n=1 Tax=Symbiodinium microadriaticum TaxID=2951 RepID=A0A1Q9EM03_SYMMI|nr:putative E3 ubiquitin-protein ligase HERC1 [Symbiodinium microadriaticum]
MVLDRRSRVVEERWLATCPIMQLKLVVLAGARVPAYRRFMMPLLSVAVLLCGTASMFTGDALRFAWYGFGLCFAVIMFYHNSLQISENSEGEEIAWYLLKTLHSGLDETVLTLSRRAQIALGAGKGRLLDSSGVVLDGTQTIINSGIQNGSSLTLHVHGLRVQATQCAFAAILGDGSVVTWGSAGFGGGGDSSAVQGQLENVQHIQASYHAFAAILGDGSVVTWGDANSGGDSSSVQGQLTNVQQIQASERAFAAILGDGSVVTWGDASYGGNSSAVHGQLKTVQQIQASAGAFAAILGDGSVVTWGGANYGGDSSAVQGQLKDVQQIQASAGAFAAILGDGSVVTWGDASYGGDSSSVQGQLKDVQQIQASYHAFAAILGDGSVVTWGDAVYGGDSSESFFHGDSDFRKLSLLLVWTWFPFPIWFTVSVEGFGLIKDPFVIEMGWVLLNVVSKFSFIVLLQRMKMVHQNKMEAARQLYGLPPGDAATEHDLQTYSQQDFAGKPVSPRGGLNPTDFGLGHGEEAGSESKLVELVAETMVTMNLGTHSNRMMKLLVDSGISNTAVLERLNQDRCMDLNLPWALISSIQKRWTTEKMSHLSLRPLEALELALVFALWVGSNAGTPVNSGSQRPMLDLGCQQFFLGHVYRLVTQVGSNAGTPVNSGSQRPMLDLGAFDEQITAAAYRAVYPLHEEMLSEFKAVKEDLARPRERMVTLLQTVNACQVLLHKLDSAQEAVLQKVDAQKASTDQLSNSYSSLHGFITGVQDSTKQALVDTVNTSSNVLLQKLDSTQQDLLKQSHESHVLLQGVATTQTSMAEKFADGHEMTSRQLMDIDGALRRKLTETEESVAKCCTDSAEKLLGSLRENLTTLSDQGTAIVEKVQRSATVQEERVTDIRRHNMMIMDILNGTQETTHKSLECIQNFTRAELLRDPAAQLETSVREVLFRQMGKLKESLLGEGSADDQGLNLKEAGSESKLVELVAETMVHQNKMEAARQLYGLPPGDAATEHDLQTYSQQDFAGLDMGWGQHPPFVFYLQWARDRCMDLNLPWALISSIQKRWTTEKMNMGQDQGGLVEKEGVLILLLPLPFLILAFCKA